MLASITKRTNTRSKDILLLLAAGTTEILLVQEVEMILGILSLRECCNCESSQ